MLLVLLFYIFREVVEKVNASYIPYKIGGINV